MAATTTLDGVHVHLPDFTRIATGLAGAEGPVVDGKARVFMVAPEKEVEGARYAALRNAAGRSVALTCLFQCG